MTLYSSLASVSSGLKETYKLGYIQHAHKNIRREYIQSPIVLQYKTITGGLDKCYIIQRKPDGQI